MEELDALFWANTRAGIIGLQEVRKLWDNVWKQSKKRLAALEASSGKHDKSVKALQGSVSGMEAQLDSASGVPAAERLEHPRALGLVLQSHARLAQLPSPPLEAELPSVVCVRPMAVHASREGNADRLKASVGRVTTPAPTALRHRRRRCA